MSLHTLQHAWKTPAPDPLAKLVLIIFGDNCDEIGLGPMETEKWAAMCATTPDEVRAAVIRLVDAGCVSINGSCLVLEAGFQPLPNPPATKGYAKRPLSANARVAVFERDGFQCVQCGTRRDLTVDHIKPESKGGAHDPSNFRTLCRPCNARKGVREHG